MAFYAPGTRTGTANTWTADQTFNDDIKLSMGTGGIASALWETADANANYLLLNLPTGGSTDVPVFGIGGGATTAVDVDLTIFNGITQPTLAVIDGDNDTALVLDYSADDAARIRTIGTTRALTVVPTGTLTLSATGSVTMNPTTDTVFANGTGVVVGHTGQIAMYAGLIPEFQMLGTGNADTFLGVARFSADGTSPTIQMAKSRNASIGSFTILQDNDEIGAILWLADDGADFANRAAMIRSLVDDGSPAENQIGGSLEFFTCTSGGTITKNQEIAADGGVFFFNLLAASASTDVNINGSNELHSVTSSAFYKYGVGDLRLDSERIYDLKPRSFRHGPKRAGAPEEWPQAEENDMEDFGLLAEEVAEIMPELVSYRDGKPFSVRYNMLSVLLLGELQRQRLVAA